MSRIPSKKPIHLEDELNKILQGKGVRKEQPRELWSTRERGLLEIAYSRYNPFTEDLFKYWLEILKKVRDLPRTEFPDDLTEVRREIDNLHMAIDTLKQELAFSKRRIDELCKKVDEIHSPTEKNTIAKLCEDYVKIVSSINIVQKVMVEETIDVTNIWTIIDAPPFEDSLRIAIYDAQLHILSMLKDQVPLDFNLLNISELSENQEPDSIIPANAKLVWEH